MRRHQPGGPEPDRQWQVRAVHDRARGDRGLLLAMDAQKSKDPPAGQPPGLCAAAMWATEAVRPALGSQIFRTGCVVGKVLLKFGQRAGEARHEHLIRLRVHTLFMPFVALRVINILWLSQPNGLRGISN